MSHYQFLPALSDEEYEALKADIAIRGVQVPIEYDEEGHVLDGHHRLRACEELGITDWPRVVRIGLSEEEKIAHILALNLNRRHLTSEQRQELSFTLRERGWSTPRIAKAFNVSDETIRMDLSHSKNLECDTQLVIVTASDGRKYRRPFASKKRRRTSVFAANKAEQERTHAALETLDTEKLPSGWVTPKRMIRLAREQQAQERARAIASDIQGASYRLLLGDFRERGQEIPDETVDLVFTDPPYPQTFLPLWSDLSAFAARILKPTGMLVTYAGALYLPEIIARLSEHLVYWWAGAIILDGPHSRVHARHIAQGSKPLLFFVKEAFTPSVWIEDTYHSEGKQKEQHDWQQSLGAALHYIEKLCPPEGLVVDPFLGGGTTAIAAKLIGRNFIGIEIDKSSLAATEERLRNSHA